MKWDETGLRVTVDLSPQQIAHVLSTQLIDDELIKLIIELLCDVDEVHIEIVQTWIKSYFE